MKRRNYIVLAVILLAALLALTAAAVSAEDGAPAGSGDVREADESGSVREEFSIPDDTPVTYGYFKAFREQIKREIIEELRSEGGLSDYVEITLARGDVIVPAPGCELIFRGGSAVAITSSAKAGDGFTDVSLATEIFSGEALVYGHIYTPAESGAEKAIIITGGTARFTVRGEYEIR
ncbi:MAG: hypothetical protein IJQ53_06530 [Clostridia bacterium]|nr:hypothetical protein [Clostridia bacterium]